MRLIDADELMEKFKEWIPKCGSELLESDRDSLENLAVSALMEIEEAPTIEAESKWIPVSERLPDLHKSVLVTIETQGGNACYVSERFERDGKERWSALCGRKPLAWMPLPELTMESNKIKDVCADCNLVNLPGFANPDSDGYFTCVDCVCCFCEHNRNCSGQCGNVEESKSSI